MRSTPSRLLAIVLGAAALVVTGAGVAAADTAVTVVTGSFDHGDVAGSASVTVRVPADQAGVTTGEFAEDDMAGSAHVTVPVVAPQAPAAAPVVRTAPAAPTVVPSPDQDVIAELIRVSDLTPAVPAAVRHGLVA